MEGDEKLTTASAKKEEGNASFKQGRCARQWHHCCLVHSIVAKAHQAAWSLLW